MGTWIKSGDTMIGYQMIQERKILKQVIVLSHRTAIYLSTHSLNLVIIEKTLVIVYQEVILYLRSVQAAVLIH